MAPLKRPAASAAHVDSAKRPVGTAGPGSTTATSAGPTHAHFEHQQLSARELYLPPDEELLRPIDPDADIMTAEYQYDAAEVSVRLLSDREKMALPLTVPNRASKKYVSVDGSHRFIKQLLDETRNAQASTASTSEADVEAKTFIPCKIKLDLDDDKIA